MNGGFDSVEQKACEVWANNTFREFSSLFGAFAVSYFIPPL
jgi:hypothetical protein